VELQEMRPGLLRWTARHPEAEAEPEPESPADWPLDVGSVAYEASDAFVFVDPLVPPGKEAFWASLDERVRGHGHRVVVLTTIAFHRRSRDDVVERYGASTSRARRTLPAGVETVPIRRAGEVMVWLPEHRTLVPGDRILGDGSGGLRLCPESWLRYLPSGMKLPELREALRPLLDRPVEMVLVSHGEPVLADGREALARALDSA
jgi:hypothetical protein